MASIEEELLAELTKVVGKLDQVAKALAAVRRAETTPKMAYSVLETCATLGITRPSLYGLIADGRLRTIKVGSRRLIPVNEIERLLAEGS